MIKLNKDKNLITKEVPVLKGEHIILRKIKESDIDERFRIGRHNEFVHMCGGESISESQYPDRTVWEDWYEYNKDDKFFWIIEADGHCIGTAGFHNISDPDNSATYRIGIFDVNYHSKGIGTETTKLLLRYGFEVMKWHRIELKVLDYNKRGIRCYEKCGFRQEGILRDSAFIDGTYHSDIVMSILDYEYMDLYGV